MRKYIVVSYYTENTSYEIEANKLIESLKKFNVEHDVVPVPNLGSWQKNTTFKATFLKQMLEKHQHKAIIWMDADSEMVEKPILFDYIDCDVAVYFRTHWPWKHSFEDGIELLSGTMYIRNNDCAKKLLDMWIEQNQITARRIEQRNLQAVLHSWRLFGGTLGLLPQSYCKIFDAERDKIAIQHNQASRRIRHEID